MKVLPKGIENESTTQKVRQITANAISRMREILETGKKIAVF